MTDVSGELGTREILLEPIEGSLMVMTIRLKATVRRGPGEP